MRGTTPPTWDARLFDLDKAANSKTYCDEWKGLAADNGITVTELSTRLQGQLVAVHPAYDLAFDGFAAPSVYGDPEGASGLGGLSGQEGLRCVRASEADGASDVFQRAGLALCLSVAAAPGGAGRGGL